MSFTLYQHSSLGQDDVTFISYPEGESDRLIDIMMYLSQEESQERSEEMLSFGYNDIVLLRDYLSSVIRLYDKLHPQPASDK